MTRLDKIIVTLCAVGAILCFARIARGQSLYVDSIPVPNLECQGRAERTLSFEKSQYTVVYSYNDCISSSPATFPPGPPHYQAQIVVFELRDGKRVAVGKSMQGIYVSKGCWEDLPVDWIKLAIREEAEAKKTSSTIAPVDRLAIGSSEDRLVIGGQMIYLASVASLIAAHVADVHSSWGRLEANPLLRSADGRFGVKGLAVKSSLVAGHLTIQALILRKWPKGRKTVAILNFALAGTVGVIAVRNYRRSNADWRPQTP